MFSLVGKHKRSLLFSVQLKYDNLYLNHQRQPVNAMQKKNG